MAYYDPCPVCIERNDGTIRPCTDMHHCFAQTKWAKKKYKERIHHLANIQFLCRHCHLNGVIKRFTELEFLKATGEQNEL